MKRGVSLGITKNLITQTISSSNRFSKYFLSVCLVPGAVLDTGHTAALLLLRSRMPTLSPCHPQPLTTPHDDSEPYIYPQACLPWQLGEEWCGHRRKSSNICWRNELERNPSLSFPQALSTGHTEWETFTGPLGSRILPSCSQHHLEVGRTGFLIEQAAHTCTRGQSEQHVRVDREPVPFQESFPGAIWDLPVEQQHIFCVWLEHSCSSQSEVSLKSSVWCPGQDRKERKAVSWKVAIPRELLRIHFTLLVREAEGTVAARRLCNTIPVSAGPSTLCLNG